jgi:hypothetical protein
MHRVSFGRHRLDVWTTATDHTRRCLARAKVRKVLNDDGNSELFGLLLSCDEEPLIAVEQRCDPGPAQAFFPGALLTSSGRTLFVGAGRRILAFDAERLVELWEDRLVVGFWGWAQHGSVVLMSAETELFAFGEDGRKLWTAFVEPPWGYEARGGSVILDVMGKKTKIDLQTGQNLT